MEEGKWIDEYNRQYAEHMDYVNNLKDAYKLRCIDKWASLGVSMIVWVVIFCAGSIISALAMLI